MLGLTGGGVHRSFGLFVWGWGMWGGFIRALHMSGLSGDEQKGLPCPYESALSWADEKHRLVHHAVRSVEPVDDSKTSDGYGRVARLTRRTGRKRLQNMIYRVVFS